MDEFHNGSTSILRIGSLKLFRASTKHPRIRASLQLTVPGPRSIEDRAPKLRYGWECFFVSQFGQEKTVYTYRKAVHSVAAKHEEIYGEDDNDRAYERSVDA